MEFNKFKQMATDYEEFMGEIEKTSKEFCLINDIKYNPMEDYYPGEWYLDDLIFDINEDRIIIRYGEDIGRCGDEDYQERILNIPMDFFNPENRDNEKLKAKQKIEEAKKLEKELSNERMKIRQTRNGINTVLQEKRSMKMNCEKYKIEFKPDEFDKKLDMLTEREQQQTLRIDNLIGQLKKYKDVGDI